MFLELGVPLVPIIMRIIEIGAALGIMGITTLGTAYGENVTSEPNDCLYASPARFVIAITIPGILVVSPVLKTRSERSNRSCEQLNSRRGASWSQPPKRGSNGQSHDATPFEGPADELQTISHVA